MRALDLWSQAGSEPQRSAALPNFPSEEELTEYLFGVFLDCGGIRSGDEVAFNLGEHSGQPVSLLARWIVNRHILSLKHHGSLLVPLFQVDLINAAVRPCFITVMLELRDVLGELEMLTWFASPNGCLGGKLPVVELSRDHQLVLCAARATRFAIKG